VSRGPGQTQAGGRAGERSSPHPGDTSLTGNSRTPLERDESLESSSHWYPGPVNEEADRAGEEPVKWLTAGELESWLSLVRLMMWLPWSIDQQLQRDSKLGMVEYQVLAMLSRSPERTLRMSSLAVLTNASLSRLSHLVKRLEERGLVRREPDPADGRFTHAILTEEGFATLDEAAPGHVAHVRSLIIDVLSPEQLRRVGLAADRIMSHIDTSGIN
jgi:DNA-binding MarR family transcriptional regulator